MSVRPGWVFFVCLLVAAGAANAQRSDVHVPPELESWRDWVLQDQGFRRCPFFFEGGAAQRNDFVCTWPDRLNLSVDLAGGRFSQVWAVYAEAQWIALPGNAIVWPQRVTVDGRDAEVVMRGDTPAIWLPPGQHTVAGQFAWDERPRRLAVPVQSGLIALTVDGERIQRPQLDRDSLWLGEQQTEKKVEDALTSEVYRLVVDDVPTRLATIFKIEVAGSVREEVLAPALPEGFIPLSIESALPARLEPNGNLRLQVRPGSWQINLLARAASVVDRVTSPQPEHNLPAAEIWSYQSNDTLRVTVAEASRPIDPAQVAVPDGWREYPGFRIEPGETLTIAERSRGRVDTDNVLQLQRILWLDFNAEGFVFADAVSGVMRSGWRMDMQAPYALLSAAEAGDNLLVTTLDGETGVELRQAAVELQALGRVDRRGEVAVSGWQARIDDMAATLNLPPGHKLFAAPGVDAAPDSWVSRWQLLDFFLLLIITIAAARLFGRVAGGVALLALLLSFHEAAAPVWTWLNLLAAAALVRVAPAGLLLRSMTWYRVASFALLLAFLVPFLVGQVRIALYPQLEPQDGYGRIAESVVAERPSDVRMADELRQPGLTSLPSSKRELSANVIAESNAIALKAPARYARYAPNALVQTGPGRPDWRWNSYQLSWSGPVDPDRVMRLVIVPAWLVSLMRFISVTALGIFAALFGRAIFSREGQWRLPGSGEKASRAGVFIGAAVIGLILLADPVAVADTPTPAILEELKQRLTEPPPCAPRCAEVVAAHADIGEQALEIRLTVNALEQVAVPLPGSANGWRPEQVVVGARAAAPVYRDSNARLWVRLERGQHSLTLRGPIPPVDSLEIPFAAPPRVMTAQSDYWSIAGIQERRLISGSINLSRLQKNQVGGKTVRWESSRFPVFVRIERTLELDLDWRVSTVVYRVAPSEGALNISIPLLDGEAITSGEYKVERGSVQVAMNPAQQSVTWNSTLPRMSPLSLQAATGQVWKEVWRFAIGSIWHVRFAGVPESQSEISDAGARTAVFYPRPGETLVMDAVRPEALSGGTLAFDQVSMNTAIGARSRSTTLALQYRSTRGTQHVIRLPAGSDVTSVSIDGSNEPLRAIDDEIAIPILPGTHALTIDWQNAAEPALRERSPTVELGAPSSNIHIGVEMPSNRWNLFTHGPRLGPAILYWSELVALIIAGLILGRIGLTPLKTRHWILLGLGFSTFSWAALAVVVVWLLAHGARQNARTEQAQPRWRFNVTQASFALLSIMAILAIVVGLPEGLLGTPDMHIRGYQPYVDSLSWFADRTDNVVPEAVVWSLPMWTYKVLILAWALWLSFALLRWLPWVWQCFTGEGLWRGRKDPPQETPATAKKPGENV